MNPYIVKDYERNRIGSYKKNKNDFLVLRTLILINDSCYKVIVKRYTLILTHFLMVYLITLLRVKFLLKLPEPTKNKERTLRVLNYKLLYFLKV